MNIARGFLLLVIGLLLILSIAMVMPFLQYFLLAVLLAYLFMPVQRRLETRLSEGIAAAIIVLGTTVAIVLPLMYVARVTVAEAISLLEAIREGEVTLDRPEERIRELTGTNVDLMSELQSALQDVQVSSLIGVVDTVTHVLIGAGLTTFLLYYFLRDREKFLAWLRETTPLPDDVQDRLREELNQILKAVLLGHVLVALLQGALAGLGLLVTGIPNATLWTVVMTVLSLLPIVGSFLVWGPAVVYLFLTGETLLAASLFLWGAIVVGISDDYLRPIIVDRYAQVNPSVIIIGVLGGIYVLGFMGIFFGPLIIGFLRSVLDVFRDEFLTDRTEMG
ncbi:AI-2E family transporter [Halobacteriales archaeon QH_2_65_14]|nr:MAG: AI-2E family transporter [Halobacteriales archaeon QH_2_65_14]